MTVFTFSTVVGQVLPAFDPAQDQLLIDDATIGAPEVSLLDSADGVLVSTVAGFVVLGGVVGTQLVSNPADGNLVFADQSVLRVGDNTIGTADDDSDSVMPGEATADQLIGVGGVDDISAGDGADLVFGNLGNDLLHGDAGNDTMLGGAGGDLLEGGVGDDLLIGNLGIDTLRGDDGDDLLFGNQGNDVRDGGAGADTAYGGADNDSLDGLAGADQLLGNLGDDTLNGGDDGDLLFGNQGNDVLDGGAGADTAYGGADNDRLDGLAGTDSLLGNLGDDTLNGGDDADILIGNHGIDSVSGDAGDDQVFGNQGDDVLAGGDGLDTLYGGADNDLIDGGAGSDTLFGNIGDDTLDGGDGDDVHTGGAGNDEFRAPDFDVTAGTDVITDFTDGDRLVLSSGSAALDAAFYGANLEIRDGTDLVFGDGVDSTLILNGRANAPIAATGIEVSAAGAASTLVVNLLATSGGMFFDTANDDFFLLGVAGDAITLTGGDDVVTSFLKVNASTIEFGGQGSDRVTIADDAAGAVRVQTGTGNDVVIIDHDGTNGFGLTSADTIDGGDGTDILGLRFTSDDTTLADTSNVSNFESLRIEVDGGVVGGTVFDLATMALTTATGTTIDGSSVTSLYGLQIAVTNGTGSDGFTVTGGDGADTLTGDDGADSLSGGAGADSIEGGVGNDTLLGGADADTLEGGFGADSLFGGAGADSLNGGAGVDTLNGGADADVLAFSAGQSTFNNRDHVVGFEIGVDDLSLGSATATQGNAGAAATLLDAATAAYADGAVADLTVGFFAFGGDGYVFFKDTGLAGSFDANNTLFVQIDGITGISAGDFI